MGVRRERPFSSISIPTPRRRTARWRGRGFLPSTRPRGAPARRGIFRATPNFWRAGIPDAAREHIREGTLGEAESLALAEAFGIRAVPRRLCQNEEEAAAAAGELGYPVVLKVSAPDVPHKTERGLVAAGLADEAALRDAFSEMSRNLAKENPPRVDGYLVQKMVTGGEEFLLGAVRDRQFGLLITAGLGGAAAEATGDISVRLAPVSRRDAEAMLDELRGARLLGPFRGRGPLDRKGLVEAIVRFGALAAALGAELLEADLNPVFVLPEGEGYTAADALFVLGEDVGA